jgi:hypothetical protein
MTQTQTKEKLPDQSWQATETPATYEELEEFFIDEIFKNIGMGTESLVQKIATPLISPFVRRFVRKAGEFDQSVAEVGFSQTSKIWLRKWTPGVIAHGIENIPDSGPFIIAINHAGTYDSLAVVASLKRKDYKLIVSANPFFRMLPHAQGNFIFATRDPHVRMATMRRAIRFLQDGGLLVMFPSGKLEPDPAYYPQEALQFLDQWSNSPEVFCRKIPGAGISVALASSVLDPNYVKHFLTRFRSTNYDKLKVSEFLQVIDLVIRDKHVDTSPVITYSKPIWVDQVKESSEGLHECMIWEAGNAIQNLMRVHAATET